MKRLGTAISLLFVVTVLLGATLFAIDRYLPYQDPLRQAAAIFVLDGEFPFRIWAALDLFHEGYAPLVIIPNEYEWQGVEKQVAQQWGYGSVLFKQVDSLQKRLPVESARALPGGYKNTAQELSAIFEYAQEHVFQNIILLTSDYHARRVRVLADKSNDRSIQVSVRMTPYQALMQDKRWMKRSATRRLVLSEFLKIVYLYLPEWL